MKKLLNKKSHADQKNPKKNLKSTQHYLKKDSFSKKEVAIGPFLTATFTAILIGLILGLMMLNTFTKKDDYVSTSNDQPVAVPKDEDVIDKTESKRMTLKEMNAYVIQLGVFSEQANADDWSETYEQLGFPSTHFQRDNQYYLFTGMAETEKKAKEIAEILLQEDIEVYVKEWTTSEIEIELTEEVDEWLVLFHNQWEETLQLLEKEEKILLRGWTELIESQPLNSEEIRQLVEAIQLLPENEVENNFELQNHLLNIWKVYEEVFKK